MQGTGRPEPWLPSREVTGRVVDSVTGEPVAGATVAAGGRSATTREDGSFELSVAETARTVSAAAPGYFENAVPLPDEGPVLIELLPRTFEEEGRRGDRGGARAGAPGGDPGSAR